MINIAKDYMAGKEFRVEIPATHLMAKTYKEAAEIQEAFLKLGVRDVNIVAFRPNCDDGDC